MNNLYLIRFLNAKGQAFEKHVVAQNVNDGIACLLDRHKDLAECRTINTTELVKDLDVVGVSVASEIPAAKSDDNADPEKGDAGSDSSPGIKLTSDPGEAIQGTSPATPRETKTAPVPETDIPDPPK